VEKKEGKEQAAARESSEMTAKKTWGRRKGKEGKVDRHRNLGATIML